jgi:hypothetical protein
MFINCELQNGEERGGGGGQEVRRRGGEEDERRRGIQDVWTWSMRSAVLYGKTYPHSQLIAFTRT